MLQIVHDSSLYGTLAFAKPFPVFLKLRTCVRSIPRGPRLMERAEVPPVLSRREEPGGDFGIREVCREGRGKFGGWGMLAG